MQIMVDGWVAELHKNTKFESMVFDDDVCGCRHIAIHRCLPNPDAKSMDELFK